MVPKKELTDAMLAAVVADVNYFADPATFIMVTLIAEPFTPTPTMDYTALTVATRTGPATPIHAASAASLLLTDPATGQQFIEVREPAGGWRWITTDDTEPAETIYGYIIQNHDASNDLGSELLPNPVVLHALTENEVVEIPSIRFRVIGEIFE